MEADVGLNFDPHSLQDTHTHTHTHKHNEPDANKQSHSALPRPDNGWRVWGVKSNETGREQQLSVCGNGVGGGRRRGQVKTQVSLSKPRPNQKERSSVRNNEHQNGCQLKLQKKRQRCLSSLLSERESLLPLLSG